MKRYFTEGWINFYAIIVFIICMYLMTGFAGLVLSFFMAGIVAGFASCGFSTDR